MPEIIKLEEEWGLEEKDLPDRISTALELISMDGIPTYTNPECAARLIKMVWTLLGENTKRYDLFVRRYNDEDPDGLNSVIAWPPLDPAGSLEEIEKSIKRFNGDG